MRKIFLFLAAMLLAVAVNAETINVSKGENKISAAISSATAGDVLVLEDGEYTEGSTIYLQKALTIKAAEGAAPVVKLTKYIRLYKSVELEGIKFVSNASESNGYCLYLHPGCETVNLEGCEFENFKQSCITSWEDFHLASLTINNCYFHDGIRGAIYCPGASLNNENPENDRSYRTIDEIEITNSTFANFTIVSGWSTSIIDVRQGDLTLDDVDPTIVKIENCTFYDNSTVSTDYADIRVYGSSNTTVTNCIFAHSASYTKRATYLGDGGVVRNCITQNYDKTGDPVYGHHSGPTIKKCQPGDPKFVDAAGGNFTLDATSDAVDYAGEDADGGDIVVTLGASRWWPAAAPEPEEPQVLYLKPGIWYWSGNNEKFAIYAFEDGKETIWSDYMTLAENETDIWTGTIPAGYTNVIFVRFGKGDNPETPDNWYESIAPDWDNGHVWNQTNDLKIEEGKDLYTITMTTWEGHSGKCPGEWSKYVYVPVVPAKYYIAGMLGNWDAKAIKATEDAYVFENLPAGNYAFKVLPTGDWSDNKGYDELTDKSSKYLYPSIDRNVCFTLSEAADVTVTYVDGETFTVESEKLAIAPIKLIGEGEILGAWDAANAVELTVAADEKSASKTFTLEENQQLIFKIIRGDEWITAVGEGNSNYGLWREWPSVSDFVKDGEGKPCVQLSGDIAGEYTITWIYELATLTVTFPKQGGETAVENAEAEMKAVKMIENGQIVIIKNGVRYNVLGAQF